MELILLIYLFIYNNYYYYNFFNILYPAGDLKATEKRLKDIFDELMEEYNWTGKSGEIPTESEYRELLEESSVFTYNGHGNGEQYFNRDKLYELKVFIINIIIMIEMSTSFINGLF